MKKHYLAVILLAMIGLSNALADDSQRQIGFNLAEMSLNPIIVSSDDSVKVKIKDSSFQPSTLTIAAGAAKRRES